MLFTTSYRRSLAYASPPAAKIPPIANGRYGIPVFLVDADEGVDAALAVCTDADVYFPAPDDDEPEYGHTY